MPSSGDETEPFRGRYRLTGLVGAGSHAQVFTAADVTLRRGVAIKIFGEDLAGNEAFKQRLVDEMRAAAAINHPCLVPIYDWGVDPLPHIVTEHFAAGSLARLLESGYRLTASQTVLVALEVGRALLGVHSAGRAHLGVDATRVLFDSEGRPYLSDLGLVPSLEAGAQAPHDSTPPTETAGGSTATGAPYDSTSPTETAGGSTATGASHDSTSPTETAGAVVQAAEVIAAEVIDPDSTAATAGVVGTSAEGSQDGVAGTSAEGSRDGVAGDTVAYTVADQQRDVRDLCLVINEAVTGAKEFSGQLELSFANLLGPLRPLLERGLSQQPSDGLDAAGLVEELLRVARLLPRPVPLPLTTAVPQTPVGSANVLAHPQRSSLKDDAAIGSAPAASVPAAAAAEMPRRRWPSVALACVAAACSAIAAFAVWSGTRPQTETVPDLSGWTLPEARSNVDEFGWEFNEVLVRESGSQAGRVLRTVPGAGSDLEVDETLDVYVSLGEPLVAVSNLNIVYGLTLQEASSVLEDLGMSVSGETRVNDEVVPRGNVIGVDVPEGVFELEVGSTVRVLISGGPSRGA